MTTAEGPGDRIEIRGFELLVVCGVLDEEQARPQPFRFDIDIHLDLRPAGRTDDLELTVNYGAVIEAITEQVADRRYLLVERLADDVATTVLAQPDADAVTVTVRKLRPPVPSQVDSTGVRIHRSRDE